jgi:hypothetical protein
MPETNTGVDEFVDGEPSPSCPLESSPQHLISPDVRTAHDVFPPTAIDATPADSPETATGVDELVVEPLPSCPEPLRPQHTTPPEVRTAQE